MRSCSSSSTPLPYALSWKLCFLQPLLCARTNKMSFVVNAVTMVPWNGITKMLLTTMVCYTVSTCCQILSLHGQTQSIFPHYADEATVLQQPLYQNKYIIHPLWNLQQKKNTQQVSKGSYVFGSQNWHCILYQSHNVDLYHFIIQHSQCNYVRHMSLEIKFYLICFKNLRTKLYSLLAVCVNCCYFWLGNGNPEAISAFHGDLQHNLPLCL